VKIIFWGTPEYSVPSLDIINNSDHEVVAVISQPDKKRSRGNKLSSSPVKRYALNNNIPIYTPEVVRGNDDFTEKLKILSCDLFIVIAYGKILPKEILEIPKYGCWNAHASLLPRWRGAAPIHWSIIYGDEFTGVGIMKMEEGLDTGDVLVEKVIKINEDENLISLTNRLSLLSSKLFMVAIAKIEENIDSNIDKYLTKQIRLNREIKYARMINKLDYKLDWGKDAIHIYQKIKGLYPRAYTNFKGKNLKIIQVKILIKDETNSKTYNLIKNKSKPGYILDLREDEGIVVATKTEPIVILEAKLEGKNITSKKQLIQQLQPIIGERFSD